MTLFRRTTLGLALAGMLAAAGASAQPPQTPPKRQEPVEEFVPIDQLPPEEQIPAANLLIPAYAFVWIAVLLYVVSVAKRLGTVQREVERLDSDLRAGKRP
jgi:CcmD family protein